MVGSGNAHARGSGGVGGGAGWPGWQWLLWPVHGLYLALFSCLVLEAVLLWLWHGRICSKSDVAGSADWCEIELKRCQELAFEGRHANPHELAKVSAEESLGAAHRQNIRWIVQYMLIAFVGSSLGYLASCLVIANARAAGNPVDLLTPLYIVQGEFGAVVVLTVIISLINRNWWRRREQVFNTFLSERHRTQDLEERVVEISGSVGGQSTSTESETDGDSPFESKPTRPRETVPTPVPGVWRS